MAATGIGQSVCKLAHACNNNRAMEMNFQPTVVVAVVVIIVAAAKRSFLWTEII